MLFDENFRTKSSPAFFAAFFRSPFFSLFFLGLLPSSSFWRLFTFFFGSYRSSRVLWRALFSNTSLFAVGDAKEEVDIPDSESSNFCFFGGCADSSFRARFSDSEFDLLSGCDFSPTETSSRELSDELLCFLFLQASAPVSSSCKAG